MLWCPLRFPHKTTFVRFYSQLFVKRGGACLIYVISVCLRIVVSNTSELYAKHREELFTLRDHRGLHKVFLGSVLLIFLVFCVVVFFVLFFAFVLCFVYPIFPISIHSWVHVAQSRILCLKFCATSSFAFSLGHGIVIL
jgi:hypothetical protein